jgi:hypothetical protein
MAVYLGALGKERSKRYLPYHIGEFIDTLNEAQLKKMKRMAAQDSRRAFAMKDKSRYDALQREIEYLNYKLGK